MSIPDKYYFMLKQYKAKKRDYRNLDIDEKINLMNLELKLNGINIKVEKFHTKAESKTFKSTQAKRRK